MSPRRCRCSSRSRRLLLLLLSLAALVCPGASLFDRMRLQLDAEDKFDILWSFYFDANGTFSIDAKVEEILVASNHTVQLLLCPASSLSSIRSLQAGQECSSSRFNAAPTAWQTQLGGVFGLEQKAEIRIEERSWFYLMQLNCDEVSYELDVSLVAHNPSGYLSLSQRPYTGAYSVLTIAWMLCVCVWVWHWGQYRHFNIRLQALLTLFPFLMSLLCLVMVYYWRVCNTTGRKPSSLYWASFFLSISSRAVQFALLMLIGKGWAITRKNLDILEMKQIGGTVLALALSYACFFLLGGICLFLVLLMYIGAMRYIFSSLGMILHEIEEQADLLASVDTDSERTPLFIKRQMFKNFHLLVLGYVSFAIIFRLWASIFLMMVPWLGVLIDHLFDVFLFVSLCYIFRLRPFRPYFYHTPIERGDRRRESIGAPLISDDVESGVQFDPHAVWKPGMPVPTIPSDYDYAPWLHPYSEALVVVENPTAAGSGVDNTQVGRPVY